MKYIEINVINSPIAMDRRTVTVLGTFRGIISVVMNSIAILTKQRKAIQINFIFPPNYKNQSATKAREFLPRTVTVHTPQAS